MSLLPLLPLLLACAHHWEGDPYLESAGAQRQAAPAPGERIELGLRDIDGRKIVVPDPAGRYVVLELIRSADW
jgi:hypothetical protein